MRTYRRYSQRPVTQEEIMDGVRAFQGQLAGLPFAVTPNRAGHRTECTTCGWSKVEATVTDARVHAATH